MKVALDVPAVDDDVAGAAANAAPLSPPAPAPAPEPEPELEESRVDFPTPPPPPFDSQTPVAPPAASPAAPEADSPSARRRRRRSPPSAARVGTGGTTPRTTETMSRQLHTSQEAVDAAMSSVDAILSRYVPAHAPPDPRSPFAPPPAEPSPPAIFTRGASPAASPRTSFREAWGAFGDAGGVVRDTERATTRASSDGWDQEVASAPGLAESALDAFLSAHVEYLGNRRYRCVLDGKVLSKFSIMRVHVARKFAGLVHQWAQDQERAATGAPPERTPESTPRTPEGSPGTPAAAEGGAAGGAGRVFPRARVRGGVWRGRRRGARARAFV